MRVFALAFGAWTALSVAAHADGEPRPAMLAPPVSGWVFEATPYAWTPWVSGDAVIKGRSFEVQQTPIQVLEALDFAYMGYVQAKNGPLTLFNDTIYADLGQSDSFVRSKVFSPHITGTLGVADSAHYKYWTVEAGGMYEVWHPDRFSVLEVLAGGRYWHQELDATVELAGTLNIFGLDISGTRAIARSGVQQWIDPFVGARLRYYPGAGQEIALRGDVGGFGAGSQFSWQALATYNWLLCAHAGLTLDGYLGWRALYVDRETGSGVSRYEFDVLQQGPVVGVTGRF
jgi:hypothetical protein